MAIKRAPAKNAPSPNTVGPETLQGVRNDEAANAKIDSQIKGGYQDILSGKRSSFSDERFKLMKKGLFDETRAQARASQQTAIAQGALSGTARSPVLQRRFQDIDNSMRRDYTKGVTEMMIAQEKAQFDDYKVGLQGMGTWLAQKRQYMIGKQQIAATIESARIQASATLGAASMAASASRYGADRMAGAAGAARREGARQFDETMKFNQSVQTWKQEQAEANFAAGQTVG